MDRYNLTSREWSAAAEFQVWGVRNERGSSGVDSIYPESNSTIPAFLLQINEYELRHFFT